MGPTSLPSHPTEFEHLKPDLPTIAVRGNNMADELAKEGAAKHPEHQVQKWQEQVDLTKLILRRLVAIAMAHIDQYMEKKEEKAKGCSSTWPNHQAEDSRCQARHSA